MRGRKFLKSISTRCMNLPRAIEDTLGSCQVIIHGRSSVWDFSGGVSGGQISPNSSCSMFGLSSKVGFMVYSIFTYLFYILSEG